MLSYFFYIFVAAIYFVLVYKNYSAKEWKTTDTGAVGFCFVCVRYFNRVVSLMYINSNTGTMPPKDGEASNDRFRIVGEQKQKFPPLLYSLHNIIV